MPPPTATPASGQPFVNVTVPLMRGQTMLKLALTKLLVPGARGFAGKRTA